jgi:hypothetical protein
MKLRVYLDHDSCYSLDEVKSCYCYMHENLLCLNLLIVFWKSRENNGRLWLLCQICLSYCRKRLGARVAQML